MFLIQLFSNKFDVSAQKVDLPENLIKIRLEGSLYFLFTYYNQIFNGKIHTTNKSW